MEGDTRQALRILRDKALRANFPGNHASYNDGWCYHCDTPIDPNQNSKYCSKQCNRNSRTRVDTGYPSTRATKLGRKT